MNAFVLGFNGERIDPLDDTYSLGNGYRAYTPGMMRFTCPDSWSPFGAGGINPYLYCECDPVNRADSSGHHSLGGWLGIGIGVALGVLMTPFSAGTSLAAALSAVSITAALASTALAVSQQFLEAQNPRMAAVLGWAALGTGIISALSSVALSREISGVKSLVSLIKGGSNMPVGGMMLQGADMGAQHAQAGGQFANPHFIGLYPAEGDDGYYMALSFTDRVEGHARLNVTGPASMSPRNNLAMGSGRWMGRYYERTHVGARALATHIRMMVASNPEIRSVRLAVPYAGRGINRVGPMRSCVQRYLFYAGVNIDITAPYGEFSTHGPAAGVINGILDGLHTDRFNGLLAAGGQHFSPAVAQDVLNQIAVRYSNTPNAFHINFNPTD